MSKNNATQENEALTAEQILAARRAAGAAAARQAVEKSYAGRRQKRSEEVLPVEDPMLNPATEDAEAAREALLLKQARERAAPAKPQEPTQFTLENKENPNSEQTQKSDAAAAQKFRTRSEAIKILESLNEAEKIRDSKVNPFLNFFRGAKTNNAAKEEEALAFESKFAKESQQISSDFPNLSETINEIKQQREFAKELETQLKSKQLKGQKPFLQNNVHTYSVEDPTNKGKAIVVRIQYANGKPTGAINAASNVFVSSDDGKASLNSLNLSDYKSTNATDCDPALKETLRNWAPQASKSEANLSKPSSAQAPAVSSSQVAQEKATPTSKPHSDSSKSWTSLASTKTPRPNKTSHAAAIQKERISESPPQSRSMG